MSLIAENLRLIKERMQQASLRSGRESQAVKLVTVTKMQPVEKMQEFLKANKMTSTFFGENYVQEYEKKSSELSGEFEAHLIGPLQRNKAKKAVQLFDLIQSVHAEPIAFEINKVAEKVSKLQRILLQVNVSLDPNKSGFLPDDLKKFVHEVLPHFKHVRCEGLMTITELYQDKAQVRKDYQTLREFGEQLFQGKLELSMGMSDDFEIAIEEGATMVRVGTALFGERGKL